MPFDLDLELGVQASKEEIVKKYRAKSPILVNEQVEGDSEDRNILSKKNFAVKKRAGA